MIIQTLRSSIFGHDLSKSSNIGHGMRTYTSLRDGCVASTTIPAMACSKTLSLYLSTIVIGLENYLEYLCYCTFRKQGGTWADADLLFTKGLKEKDEGYGP